MAEQPPKKCVEALGFLFMGPTKDNELKEQVNIRSMAAIYAGDVQELRHQQQGCKAL